MEFPDKVAGQRADGGIHTWMVCEYCKTNVRASRHSPEDCDTIVGLRNTMSLYDGMVTREEDADEIVRLQNILDGTMLRADRLEAHMHRISAYIRERGWRKSPINVHDWASLCIEIADDLDEATGTKR